MKKWKIVVPVVVIVLFVAWYALHPEPLLITQSVRETLSCLPRMKSMPKPGRSLAKKIW